MADLVVSDVTKAFGEKTVLGCLHSDSRSRAGKPSWSERRWQDNPV